MIKGQKVVVVLPAYNAAKTLRQTYNEIDRNIVDEVILVDDFSSDNTFEIANEIGIKQIIRHEKNKGYGGNQKTCYRKAMEEDGDIIIKLHPEYFFNRILTGFQNLLMGQKLSEYHTGYRAFHKDVLLAVNFENNSDDFVFDNELLAQIFFKGYEVAEITCPTKYFKEASSINLERSIQYGAGVIRVSFQYALQKIGFGNFRIFRG